MKSVAWQTPLCMRFLLKREFAGWVFPPLNLNAKTQFVKTMVFYKNSSKSNRESLCAKLPLQEIIP